MKNYLVRKALSSDFNASFDEAFKHSKTHIFGAIADGKETPRKTYFKMGYDHEGLIVKFKSEYAGELNGEYAQFGSLVYRHDCVEIFLSPYGDLKRYYEFDVSPYNGLFAAKIYNIDNFDAEATPFEKNPIKTWSKINETTYEVSYEIPFAAIVKPQDLSNVKNLPWLFNAFRVEVINGERTSRSLSPTGSRTHHNANAFVKIQFE